MLLLEQLYDPMRIDFHYGHLSYLLKAIKEGANVKGYFAWSFLDDFEWNNSYTIRFVINFVDYLKWTYEISKILNLRVQESEGAANEDGRGPSIWDYFTHVYPGRCSAWQQLNCTGGDSGTKPYLVAHHLLLAHAAAVKLYLDPLVNGDYPYSMHSLVGGRLPKFSNEQSEVMKDSFDFIGMNYYGADYAQNAPQILIPSYTSDSCTNLTSEN
ncbi:hypothetical protein CDL15_Pgr026566 [Punica granatum]|uniref:Beta-glucosidase 12-like n=1 Tax=Punica granatum TaxID=22663 RepID=A0A218WKW1_PUNGR|nr:hypothetical protein CDL15_Pgr026566 [Punica granatum]